MSFDKEKSFEEKLRAARPADPPEELEKRLSIAIQKAGRHAKVARLRQLTGWGGMAVAAGLLITFGILLFNGRLDLNGLSSGEALADRTPADVSELQAGAGREDGFTPVFAENNLKSRVDEGIVFLRNGLTARRYRYEFIDRVVWQNPSDGAVVEVEVPRDEVVLVPVQTF